MSINPVCFGWTRKEKRWLTSTQGSVWPGSHCKSRGRVTHCNYWHAAPNPLAWSLSESAAPNGDKANCTQCQCFFSTRLLVSHLIAQLSSISQMSPYKKKKISWHCADTADTQHHNTTVSLQTDLLLLNRDLNAFQRMKTQQWLYS